MKYIIFNKKLLLICSMWFCIGLSAFSQGDTITLGFGNFQSNASISSSDPDSDPEVLLEENGFLPNEAAASKFLTHATLGFGMDEIIDVTTMGLEDWIDDQFAKPYNPTIFAYTDSIQEIRKTISGDPFIFPNSSIFFSAWYDYHMKSDDYLRQRIAFALSEIFVISYKSNANTSLGLASYYEVLMENAFGTFDSLLYDVTYHPYMAVFLTYLRNPKSNPQQNRFPDENYAREVMQLFTIGLYELNNDGTRKVDGNGNYIPTYDNNTIAEFAKIFTGLSWGDNQGYYDPSEYRPANYRKHMKMYNEYHEPGVKNLLNGFVVPDRNPVDGNADIRDALNNLFNHPNVGPFIAYRLIQRLVTSNPSPDYVNHVASAFNDNGNGVRGDMKAVIKAILLYDLAKDCQACEKDEFFGKLSEPFQRFMQLNKTLEITTPNGDFRHAMHSLGINFEQKPLGARSVFNFFLPDYTPIGPVDKANKVAPEFQITNSQSILSYMNHLQDILVYDNIAEEWSYYTNEPTADIDLNRAEISYDAFLPYTDDNKLHILLDQLNLILAAGRLSDEALEYIKENILDYDIDIGGQYEIDQREARVKIGIYQIMVSPEFLVKK